jgi:predicted metal-binding membrane protein
MSRTKAASEGRRAQVAEALVLVVTAGWATHLIQKEERQQDEEDASLQAEQRLLQAATMSHALFILHMLGFSAAMWSIFRPQALSKILRRSSRLAI